MTNNILYRYSGACSLVILHERYLREFVETWKRAKAAGVPVPEVADPDYKSLETILHHVLRWARWYMVWICEKLDLPDPVIGQVPPAEQIGQELDTYLEHLLDKWRAPLQDVPEEQYFSPLHTTPWNVDCCIWSILEHSIVHTIQHRFQLERFAAE
ncbi:hypothetical protein ACFL6L_02505 [candidate division KSB1 bacterium]